MEVAVVATVHACQAAQVGRGLVGGDGALAVARDRCRIVSKGGKGAVTEVKGGVGDIRLGEDPRLLQVAVGDVPLGVVEGDDAPLEVVGEGGTPEQGCLVLGEEHPAHANFGSVYSSDNRRVVRDEFGEARGPVGDTEGQAFEVAKVVTEVGGDAHAVFIGKFEAELHGAKEACGARDGRAHEAQFTQDALPLPGADASFVAEVVEDGGQPGFAAVREFEGARGSVKDPSEDLFALVPASITFCKLLLGDGFLSGRVVRVRPGEDAIDGVHDAAPRVPAAALGALGHTNEVIHKHVHVRHGGGKLEERGSVPRRGSRWGQGCGPRRRRRAWGCERSGSGVLCGG